MRAKTLLVSMLAILSLTQAKADTSYWDGSSWSTNWYTTGAGSVYHIKTAEDLAGFSKCFSQGYYMYGQMTGYTIILDNDIDLNGNEWTPIGISDANNSYCSFDGTFDGNGHTIKGLHISNADSYRMGAGLFGVFLNSNAIIKNLKVSGDINITPTGYDYSSFGVGGIAGYIQASNVQIENCVSEVNITVNYGSSVLSNNVGGVVGAIYNLSDGVVKRCSYSGNITVTSAEASTPSIGGIAGDISQTPLSECSSTATINAISGGAHVGGIAGQTYSGSISDCYYQGNISGSGSWIFAGGISGNCQNIKNSVAIPTFTSNGGGYFYSDPIECMTSSDGSYQMENCFYLGESSSHGYGTYLSESDMKNGEALSGFDTSLWTFEAGNYPALSFTIHKYKVYVNTEHGIFGSLVKEGGIASMSLTCDEGWTINNLYVNDVDYTSMLENDVLTLKDITEDKHISIVYANSTNIATVKETKGSVSMKDGKLLLKDFANNTRVSIYDVDGKLIHSKVINSEESLDLPQGIYIIKAGMKSFKVSL